MGCSLETLLRRNDDILHSPVGNDETVMMSIEKGRYYSLNDVGARIWELLETPRTVGELCQRICSEFDVDAPTCEVAVLNFSRDLVANDLVLVG